MTDQTDVLLALYAEERTQARHSEEQRATFTNLVLVATAAGLGFIAQRGFHTSALAVTIPMVVIGVGGAVTNAKYFERWLRHWTRANAYRAQLLELHPEIGVKLQTWSLHDRKGSDGYEHDIAVRFPRLSRLRLYKVWVALNVTIALGGALLTLILLLS